MFYFQRQVLSSEVLLAVVVVVFVVAVADVVVVVHYVHPLLKESRRPNLFVSKMPESWMLLMQRL